MVRTRDWRSAPLPPGRSTNVRLLVSIGMLVILAMMILQARDPANWQWLTGEEAKREPVYADYEVQEGPIDTDPEEWSALARNFDVIKDNQLKDDNLNAVQKNRLLKWVLRQKPEELYRRKPATERLGDLTNRPQDFRGKLVRFRLRIKRCLPIPSPDPSNPDFANLHEMLGFQDKTGLWIYWLFTPGIPKGFPVGEQIDGQTVDVVGYFHAHRRYVDANEKTYFAPEIVGTAVWYPVEKLPPQPITIPLMIGFAVVLPIGVLVLWKLLSGPSIAATALPRSRSDVDVTDWLEKGEEHPMSAEVDDGPPSDANGRARFE
jgi:hypothetical protein